MLTFYWGYISDTEIRVYEHNPSSGADFSSLAEFKQFKKDCYHITKAIDFIQVKIPTN